MLLNDPKYEEEITESQDIIEDINDDRLVVQHPDVNTDSCADDQLSATSSIKLIDKDSFANRNILIFRSFLST